MLAENENGDNYRFDKFEIDMSREDISEQYLMTDRIDILTEMAQDMIYQNRFKIGNIMESMVKQKFVCPKTDPKATSEPKPSE